MKNIANTLLLFFISYNIINAQTIDWLERHPANTSSDYYKAVTYDNSANSYNTGIEYNNSLGGCLGKILISSFSPTGSLRYSTPYQSSSNNGICDEAGSAILYHAGSSKIIVGGKENSNAFLGFFDSATGAFLNKATISSSGSNSEIKGMHLNGNHIFAVGYFRNSITFGGSPSISLSGSSQYSLFVAKFDMSGNVVQAIKANGIGNSQVIGYDIVEDAGNNIYISVAANDDIVFSSSTYGISGSGYKVVICKLDASLSFSSAVNVASTPYNLTTDIEFPIELDWNSNNLVASGVHQNQWVSFLSNIDIPTFPTINYTHSLNRVVRDIALDCNDIYLTGTKSSGSNSKVRNEKRAIPCYLSTFMFLDRHSLATGLQLSSKQASGCTYGEGVIIDKSDNIWANGFYGGDVNNITFESLTVSPPHSGPDGFISKLTIDSSCVVESKFCCPGDNLVVNGDFESGNTGFTSDFMYQSVIALNSVIPGQYGIMNGSQSSSVSPIWSNIQDPSTCSNTSGNFLIVNGENGGGPTPPSLSNSIPPSKIIWEQTFTVQDWRGYKFCFDAKSKIQSGFNVEPKLEVQFSMPFGNITQAVPYNSGICNWQRISKNLDLWGYGTTLNIKIVLDQSDFGDGNDIAIDNISLILLDQCSTASAGFDITTTTPHPTNPSFFSISASADIIPPCNSVWWEVCKYDPATSDCIAGTKVNGSWWTVSTNFPGYDGTNTLSGTDPGFFEYGFFYRITRGTWGECNSWKSTSKILSAPSSRIQIKKFALDDFNKNKKKILKSFEKEKKKIKKLKK